MIWPLITSAVYALSKEKDGVTLYDAYLQLIILIFAIPLLFGMSGLFGRVLAAFILIYVKKNWRGSSDERTGSQTTVKERDG